jgi:hypothetical protein
MTTALVSMSGVRYSEYAEYRRTSEFSLNPLLKYCSTSAFVAKIASKPFAFHNVAEWGSPFQWELRLPPAAPELERCGLHLAHCSLIWLW